MVTVADRDPVVVVSADESLDDVILRLREAAKSGHPLELVVPIDNPLLLTASEFRRLKDAADADRLPVTIRTADPLRLRLAERLGLHAKAMSVTPPARRAAAPIVPPAPVVSAPPPEPAPEPEPAPFLSVEPTVDPTAHWPRTDRDDAATELAAPEIAAEEAEPRPRTARGKSLLRWLVGAAVLVALVAGVYLAIQFAIPSATIAITPDGADVQSTVLFDVASDGAPLDEQAAFALVPGTTQVTVTWEGSTPATGSRAVPDATATGSVELRNAGAEPITVGPDAVMTTEGGIEFSLTEPVEAPAADSVTGQPGVATGQIRALMAGTAGNVGEGEVGGRLENGIYYSNLNDPTSGGTDRTFTVVSQADVDSLLSQASDSALGLAREALARDDAGGSLTVTSVSIASQDDAFDRDVDEEAENVSLKATMVLDASTYDRTAAMAELMPIVEQQLAAKAPPGAVVDANAIVLSEPTVVESNDQGTRVEVEATGKAWHAFSEAEKTSLAAALAGMTDENAATVLRETPGIAEFQVAYAPTWLPREMPNNPGRITIEVDHP